MTYIVTKIIKGNPYLYEVRSEREGDSVRQVFVRYLGRADAPSSIERQPRVSRRERRAESRTKRVPFIPVTTEPEVTLAEFLEKTPITPKITEVKPSVEARVAPPTERPISETKLTPEVKPTEAEAIEEIPITPEVSKEVKDYVAELKSVNIFNAEQVKENLVAMRNMYREDLPVSELAKIRGLARASDRADIVQTIDNVLKNPEDDAIRKRLGNILGYEQSETPLTQPLGPKQAPEAVERREIIRRPAVVAVSEAVTPTEVKPSVTPEVIKPVYKTHSDITDDEVAGLVKQRPDSMWQGSSAIIYPTKEQAISSEKTLLANKINVKNLVGKHFSTVINDKRIELNVGDTIKHRYEVPSPHRWQEFEQTTAKIVDTSYKRDMGTVKPIIQVEFTRKGAKEPERQWVWASAVSSEKSIISKGTISTPAIPKAEVVTPTAPVTPEERLQEALIKREPVKTGRKLGYDIHKLSPKDDIDKGDYADGYRYRVGTYPNIFMAKNEREIADYILGKARVISETVTPEVSEPKKKAGS